MKSKKGFTLIELLAVIVILAIIMVIAVPRILDVINESRESANASSIKLLKEGIKTQVMADNLNSTNKFTKDGEGCYLFDFDSENQNYKNLNIDNKDNFSGTLKYCEPNFDDSNLSFKDGATVKNLYDTNKLVGINDGNHNSVDVTYDGNNYWYMWTWDSSTPSEVYYNQKINVKAGDKLVGKVVVYTNLTGQDSNQFKIGFSPTNTTADDFVQSQSLSASFYYDGSQLPSSRVSNDSQIIELTATTSGSYYVKALLYNPTLSGSRYAAITELKLEKN